MSGAGQLDVWSVVLSNKVRTGDGRWLTLDGRSLYSAIPELSATFDAGPATAGTGG